MNTQWFHGAAQTTNDTYKVSTDQNAVINVKTVESKVTMNFETVNSDGNQRSSILTASGAKSGVLSNKGMVKGHIYYLKAWTDAGSFYNTYNTTGDWNPDEY